MLPDPGAGPAAVRRRAILFVLGSSASFTVSAALVKLVAAEIPTVEIMLFRSFVAFLCMVPLIVRGGGWSVLRTRRPWGHALRTATGLGGMFGSFYGLAHLPMAATTALGFAMPLVLAVLSVPMLGERVSRARGVSIAAGLVGVLLVVRPWQGAKGLPLFESGVVLLGVASTALAMASIRRMGQSGENNVTIVVLFSLCCSVATAALAAPVWVMPSAAATPILLGIGVVSAGAQLLMTAGYRSGESSMLAPFEYSAILYTVLLGWLVWNEVPGVWEMLGIAVLVASGLFTWWREVRG